MFQAATQPAAESSAADVRLLAAPCLMLSGWIAATNSNLQMSLTGRSVPLTVAFVARDLGG
jgi:hypothetical protein